MMHHLSGVGQRWKYEAVVAGAGPVGIAAALELAARGRRVLLVDSGDTMPDPQLTWRLGRGEVVGDPRFGQLDSRINRAIGGTSWRWCVDLMGTEAGVRYAPIERGVLERRPEGQPAWPFDWDELVPWYDKALAVAQVGAAASVLDQRDSERLPGLDDARYLFGPASAFQGPAMVERLTAAGVDVLVDATVTELVADEQGDRITSIRVQNLGGGDGTIEADSFLLAMGTVDTTRALLAAQATVPALAANRRIGRNLMDRPRIHGVLELLDAPPDWFVRLGMHRDPDVGGLTMERFISHRADVAAGLASTSFLLMPEFDRGRVSRRTEVLIRKIVLDLPDLLTARVACRLPAFIGRILMSIHRRTYRLRSRVLRTSMATTYDTEWAGWTADPRWTEHRRWRITAITEQAPHPLNRISLSTERDELGVPKPVLEWGAPSAVTDSIGLSLDAAAKAFAKAGLGTLTWGPELAAVSSCHMMGTVAIGDDPELTAADSDCRVRGTANLYVAGNAVIPQSGHGNPTLAAMAIAMRTASRMAATA